MKTYPVKDSNETQIAFEIENIYINIKSIMDLLSGIKEVKNIKTQNLLADSEYRVTFEYNGIDCVVWEPFNDNSRYWIGPENPDSNKVDVRNMQAVFDLYRPNPIRKLFGDLLQIKRVVTIKF